MTLETKVCFVLDQHAELDFNSATVPEYLTETTVRGKTCRPTQDTSSWFRANQSLLFPLNAGVLRGEATNTNVIVFGLVWPLSTTLKASMHANVIVFGLVWPLSTTLKASMHANVSLWFDHDLLHLRLACMLML